MSKIIWKTKIEIEEEENQPQPITESERISNAEQAINDLIMTIMMGGM